MRLAAALLAVMFIPLAVVAGVQRAEAPRSAGLAAMLAGAYGAGAVVLWIAGEAVGRKARRGGWR